MLEKGQSSIMKQTRKKKNHKKRQGHSSLLLALLFFVFMLPVALVVLQRNESVRPKALAAGNTYFANPGDNIQSKLSILQPGDTLIFNDGIYSTLRLDPNSSTALHGTATAPITLKAANDGKAIFDPNGTAEPVFVTGSSYVTLQGFVARNSSGNVLDIYGAGSGGQANDHITLQRITAHDAADGNYHVFNISYPQTNILVEDCAAWGRARYDFIAYHASYVTFRRDWGYWEKYTSFANAPRAPFSVYGSSNVTFENVIGTDAIPTQTEDDYFTSVYHTTDDTVNYPSNNLTILGSIFYNNCAGYWENSSAGSGTVLKDNYYSIPSNPTCPQYSTRPYGDGLVWNYNPNSGIISNNTFVNNNVGLNRFNAQGSPIVTNSVFLNNNQAFVSDAGHSYSDFYGNGSLGTTLTSTDKTANPGYDTTTYGTGAYFFVPPGSLLKNAGQGGSDMGANIIYQYNNGTVTATPLWPWPMEGRIMAERGISVTYASSGGFWKTLTGVYGSSATPTPTPGNQGANSLQNPSFETGIPPWFLNTNAGAATLTQDTTTAAPNAGVASAKMNVTQSAGNIYDMGIIQQPLAITNGQQYTVSFWAKADTAGRQVQASISQAYSPYTPYSNWLPFTLSTSWQQYSFTYTPSVTDNNVELEFVSGQSTGTVWFDSMSMTAGSPTATPTPIPPTNTLTPVPPTPTPTIVLDTTPPTVTVTAPKNNTTVTTGATITLSATASDNVGVNHVNFLVNGTLLCSDITAPYSCSWTIPATNNVTYTITAQAYDAAGNASSNSVQVTATKKKRISVSG